MSGQFEEDKLYEFDDVLWDVSQEPYQPVCPKHLVKLVPFKTKNVFEQTRYMTSLQSPDLMCPQKDTVYYLPGHNKKSATEYVKDIISGEYKNKDIIRIDEDRFITVEKETKKIDERFKIEIKLEKDTKKDIARYAVVYIIDRQTGQNPNHF